VRVLDNRAGGRDQHQPGVSAHAAGAQHDHVGLLARVDEFLDREAVHGLDGDRLRVRSVQPGQHLVGLCLHCRLSLLGELQVLRGGDDAAVVTHDGRVHGEHAERRVSDGRFVHGPLQGPL
jgi:hypothetical protein